jgi:hypothetical protein
MELFVRALIIGRHGGRRFFFFDGLPKAVVREAKKIIRSIVNGSFVDSSVGACLRPTGQRRGGQQRAGDQSTAPTWW